jgi:UDP-N-acetylglucosamine 2-epimerase (non-hydrolysing)
MHPRTAARIESAGLSHHLKTVNLVVMSPLGYLENLGLMAHARVVLTDSGGIQEETTALGVPCLTLRDNTERPITVEQGTNVVVGSNPDRIQAEFHQIMSHGGKRGRVPELWDGKAAARIVREIDQWLSKA